MTLAHIAGLILLAVLSLAGLAVRVSRRLEPYWWGVQRELHDIDTERKVEVCTEPEAEPEVNAGECVACPHRRDDHDGYGCHRCNCEVSVIALTPIGGRNG